MERLQFNLTLVLLCLLICWAAVAAADNDVTNSNNTNTSTQTNEITHNDTYDSHDQVNDSSTSTDNSVDNSAYSHNTDGSYNQANQSWQTITNTNTEGDLSQSKNTNSFNDNTGNSNGSNVNQNATGGSSTSDSTSRASVSGVTSGAAALVSTGAVKTGVSTGATNVNTGAVNVVHQQVRQTPMAWSPGLAMSMSQENCNNSASLGVSAGFGAISGGVPINDNDCTRRRDAILWANLGQMRIACERMIQDSGNLDAMRAAGTNCAELTKPVVAPAVVAPSALNVPPNSYWARLDEIAKYQLDAIYKKNMSK